MATNNNFPKSSPLKDQVPNNPKLGIQIPLGLPEHLPQQEMTLSPVAPNENNVNFLGLCYRVDVKALKMAEPQSPSSGEGASDFLFRSKKLQMTLNIF